MSHVVILGPASSGQLLVEYAKEAGHRVTVALPPAWKGTPQAGVRQLADDVLWTDPLDAAALQAAVDALRRDRPVDAVVPGFEYYVPAAAATASRLGLPGLGADAAGWMRYKHLMRRALLDAEVRSAEFRVVDTARPDWLPAVEEAVRHLALPCVVKPVDLGGSVMVRLVRSTDEALRAVREIAAAGPDTFGLKPLPLALIEEYIQGPEYSVEGYMTPEGPSVVSITRKLLGGEPYFVERGHVVGAILPRAVDEAVGAYVENVTSALGLDVGVFHGEVRLTEQGPVLMELGARLPGDRICELVGLARGVNLAAVFVESLIGVPPPPYTPDAESSRAAGIRFMIRPGLEQYSQVIGFDEARDLDGHVDSALSYGPGEAIPQATDFSGRLGWFICTAPDADTLEALLDKADDMVEFS
ncbi:ATP-grasp domain-containing protein [Streptomyces sp. NPDC057375]|uniref:ATP-grasp domain-containing protein n=1 Tax=Streptomyces sp. NPDC057375 TaxID=3346109 RepID=UPI003629B0F0